VNLSVSVIEKKSQRQDTKNTQQHVPSSDSLAHVSAVSGELASPLVEKPSNSFERGDVSTQETGDDIGDGDGAGELVPPPDGTGD
jgi:hypothetical protein